MTEAYDGREPGPGSTVIGRWLPESVAFSPDAPPRPRRGTTEWLSTPGRESRRRSRYVVPVVTEHEVWAPPRKLRISDFATRPRLLAHLMATGAEFEPMRRKTPLVPPKPAVPRSVIPARPRASGGVIPSGRHMIHATGHVVSVGAKPVGRRRPGPPAVIMRVYQHVTATDDQAAADALAAALRGPR
jgi:hypothetical protein